VGVERGLDPAEQFALHEAVDSLDDPLREVFEMTYYEGMTQAEIAAVVGVSERTVKRRWREARQRLRRALRDDSEAGRGTAGDWRAGI
jgi:RNA polymerase sigma factor (sigma-70 family)